MNIKNISSLIPSQLPEYIRSNPDYSKFVSFLQAYYEWMESENNILYNSTHLLDYRDVDNTTEQFLTYFTNEFLQYFPKDSLISKSQAIKVARELYKSKGTIASYQFLFRILYNSDFDVFYTKDVVFKPSDGAWYATKSLKVATNDVNFLNVGGCRIVGESSQSIATIESSVVSGSKIEIFISNIERLFQTGEMVRVIDNNNQDLYFLNGSIQIAVNGSYPIGSEVLRAKLVGQISQINISPKNRGQGYISGNPVILYGGLTKSISSIGATAQVGKTTTGSIQKINVINGGFGYGTESTINIDPTNSSSASATYTSVLPPNIIILNGGSGYNSTNDYVINGTPSSTNYIIIADVSGVDENGSITSITYRSGVDSNSILGITANVVSTNTYASSANIKIANAMGKGNTLATSISTNTIASKLNNTINAFSVSTNATTKLSAALSFLSIDTYAIGSVIVNESGTNFSALPTITAKSLYSTDSGKSDLSTLGILSPIQIIQPGSGYATNDKIIFSGGSGYGASANVTSVDSSGTITSISYVSGASSYPLGGMGYNDTLPTLTISSSAGHGAQICVLGTLGKGAILSPSLDAVGSITSIDMLTYGEDYISSPNVSLKVSDIVVTNITLKPISGDIVYQGSSYSTATFFANVDSIINIDTNLDSSKINYRLRVYDYNSRPSTSLPLKILGSNATLTLANASFDGFDSSGIITYGDGSAKASATFLNGLTIGQGQYLNDRGQPSAFSVLQSEYYNNYTYQITVEKEIAKYRETLLNLLHPSGMKVLGRYAIKSNSTFSTSAISRTPSITLLSSSISNPTTPSGGTSGGEIPGPIMGTGLSDVSNSIASMSVDWSVSGMSESTNLQLYGENFNTTPWIKSGLTAIPNSIIAPDNSINGTKILETTTNSKHTIFQNFVATSGNIYTQSIYAKADGRSILQIASSNGLSGNTISYQNYNLSTGQLAGNNSVTFSNIIYDATTGWCRCIFSDTSVILGTARFVISITNDSNASTTPTYQGIGGSGVYIFGSQVELGSVSNYIPTKAYFTSRNSIGTYVGADSYIHVAGNNVARIGYNPANTLAPAKVIVEIGSSNLITYSNVFTSNTFSVNNATLSVNSNVAPDGTLTATKLVGTSVNNIHGISFGTTYQANTIYTSSIFVKPAEKTWICLKSSIQNYSTSNVWFNLTNGSVGAIGDTANSFIQYYGNGWYRCSLSYTTLSNVANTNNIALLGSSAFDIYPFSSANTSNSYGGTLVTTIQLSDGDGISNCTSTSQGVHIWGSQLESGSFATSYIPTGIVSVTRSSDVSTSNIEHRNELAILPSNKSTNIIQFYGLGSNTISTYMKPNDFIRLHSMSGDNVSSEIVSVNNSLGSSTITNNVWLIFANVAVAIANSGSNTIHISLLTGSYDGINNGNYTNPSYPLLDIVKVGDKILLGNNTTRKVTNVDAGNNIITVNSPMDNNANTFLSVNRTIIANANNIQITSY
jgi:hypothetical protein